MADSILQSVKKLIGLMDEDTTFDFDVTMHINTAFFTLYQLGIGPTNGFNIEGPEETWESYTQGDKNLASVKSYVYLKVKLLFDPPETSNAQNAMQKLVEELETRLSYYRESSRPSSEEITQLVSIDGGVV